MQMVVISSVIQNATSRMEYEGFAMKCYISNNAQMLDDVFRRSKLEVGKARALMVAIFAPTACILRDETDVAFASSKESKY